MTKEIYLLRHSSWIVSHYRTANFGQCLSLKLFVLQACSAEVHSSCALGYILWIQAMLLVVIYSRFRLIGFWVVPHFQYYWQAAKDYGTQLQMYMYQVLLKHIYRSWTYELSFCECSRSLDNAKIFAKVVVSIYTPGAAMWKTSHWFISSTSHGSLKLLNFCKLSGYRMLSHCGLDWHFHNY